MKQSNYITLFLAPVALLAGMGIASLPRIVGRLALAACVVLGLLLGALQQADYRAFTANTKALAAFAAQHPYAVIVGSSNNSGLGSLWVSLEPAGPPSAAIVSFREVSEGDSRAKSHLDEADDIYAVLDRQTMNWFAAKAPVTSPLPCWQHVAALGPADLELGYQLAARASSALTSVKPAAAAMARRARAEHADVYRVVGPDVLCQTR